ncbi:MAG: hypothetical protein ISS45_04935 [Candidatus Omnitrophica bacterium]|nr:hypothetical protein [Candidatus Omnitrophota bacterium]
MQTVILNKIFETLLKENNFCPDTADNILRIKNRIFSGFNSRCTFENQRFDFSFSFRDKLIKAIRFSYNNYAEKEHFISKIIAVCEIFGSRYNIKKLRRILKIMQPDYLRHQTTVGVEWLADNPYPRFKVYFEELRHNYTIEERLEKLQYIYECIGFNRKKMRIFPKEDIAAICIDFLPNGELQVKTYIFTKQLNKFLAKIHLERYLFLRKRAELFRSCLLKEDKFFYYFTKRFSSASELLSTKIYKIYEVSQITDPSLSILEIKELFRRLGLLKEMRQVELISNICEENKLILYPVIASMDLQFPNESKIDLYYSFRDKGIKGTNQ